MSKDQIMIGGIVGKSTSEEPIWGFTIVTNDSSRINSIKTLVEEFLKERFEDCEVITSIAYHDYGG